MGGRRCRRPPARAPRRAARARRRIARCPTCRRAPPRSPSEHDADVFDRVVHVDLDVALGPHRQVDQRVLGERGQQVVEERHRGVDVGGAGAVEVEHELDARLARLAANRRRAVASWLNPTERRAVSASAPQARERIEEGCGLRLGARGDPQVVRDADVADDDVLLEQRLERRVRVVHSPEQHEVRRSCRAPGSRASGVRRAAGRAAP